MDSDTEILDSVHQLQQTHFANATNKQSLKIKYAQSYFQSMTASLTNQQDLDQSEVIEKQSVQYQAMEFSDNNRSHINGLSNNQHRRMSGTAPAMQKSIYPNQIPNPQPSAMPIIENNNEQLMIHSNHNICQHGLDTKQQKENVEKIQKQRNQQTSLKYNKNNKFVNISSFNFNNTFKIYHSPIQINLPFSFIIQQQNNEIETIVPCIFKNIPQPKSQTKVNHEIQKNSQKIDHEINKEDFEHFAMTKSEVEQESQYEKQTKNDTVTDILLQKINELSTKIKQLQKQKNLIQKPSKNPKMCYSQTNSIPISNNNNKIYHNKQLFSTKSSSNTKNQKLQLQSNIYSFNLHFHNSIFNQINMLKFKINLFYNQQQNAIRNSKQEFQKEKINGIHQKQFKGRIVKIKGPNQTCSPSELTKYHEEFNYESIEPKRQSIQKSHNYRSQLKMQNQRKSSFSIQKEEVNYKQTLKQFQTLQLLLAQQNCLQLENYDKSSICQQIQQSSYTYVDDISIPQLDLLSSQSSLQDLVQIGKETFQKFGCQIDHEKPFKVKKYKNCVYFKFENFNILWHFDGKVYFGGWKTLPNGEGQKNGEGIEFVPGKYKFKGNFKDGKRCGFGKLLASNGTAYVGQWLNGLKHGRGKLIQSNELQYEGDWQYGKKNGKGTIYFKSVKQFQGNWKDNLKYGYGKEFFRNGDYYEGFYENNKFHGEGKYTWKNKANYHGQFKEGKRHGNGLWRSAEVDYDEYEGNYFEDHKNGQGQYRWANGTIYNGTFKNDLKHGKGTITYSNGRTSKMNWVNGSVKKTKSVTSRCRNIKSTREDKDQANYHIENKEKQAKNKTYNKSQKANSKTNKKQKLLQS